MALDGKKFSFQRRTSIPELIAVGNCHWYYFQNQSNGSSFPIRMEILLTRGKEYEVKKLIKSIGITVVEKRKEGECESCRQWERSAYMEEKQGKGRKLVSIMNLLCGKPCVNHFILYLHRSVEAATLSWIFEDRPFSRLIIKTFFFLFPLPPFSIFSLFLHDFFHFKVYVQYS